MLGLLYTDLHGDSLSLSRHCYEKCWGPMSVIAMSLVWTNLKLKDALEFVINITQKVWHGKIMKQFLQARVITASAEGQVLLLLRPTVTATWGGFSIVMNSNTCLLLKFFTQNSKDTIKITFLSILRQRVVIGILILPKQWLKHRNIMEQESQQYPVASVVSERAHISCSRESLLNRNFYLPKSRLF